MNKTINIGLNQFERTDFFKIENFNENYSIIDKEIKDVKTDIEKHTQELNNIGDEVDSIQQDTNKNKEDIIKANEEIAKSNLLIQGANTNIANLNELTSDHEDSLDTINTKISQHDTSISTVNQSIVGINESIADIEDENISQQNSISDLSTSLEEANESITTLRNDTYLITTQTSHWENITQPSYILNSPFGYIDIYPTLNGTTEIILPDPSNFSSVLSSYTKRLVLITTIFHMPNGNSKVKIYHANGRKLITGEDYIILTPNDENRSVQVFFRYSPGDTIGPSWGVLATPKQIYQTIHINLENVIAPPVNFNGPNVFASWSSTRNDNESMWSIDPNDSTSLIYKGPNNRVSDIQMVVKCDRTADPVTVADLDRSILFKLLKNGVEEPAARIAVSEIGTMEPHYGKGALKVKLNNGDRIKVEVVRSNTSFEVQEIELVCMAALG